MALKHALNNMGMFCLTDIVELGRCMQCLKWKKSTVYCRLTKQHKEDKASVCQECFRNGASVTHCRLVCGHDALPAQNPPGSHKEQFPSCVHSLQSLKVNNSEYSASGFLDPYTENAWSLWLQNYCSQSGIQFKISTGKNQNKEANVGVLSRNGILEEYKVMWRSMYVCFRGGKPRYKNTAPEFSGKHRNAPGSRLMNCKAAIHARLLRTVSGLEMLQITFPLVSAHTGHTPQSLADLQAHKPLPELQIKLESLITHSHLNKVSLMLALQDYIDHDLIPEHLRQGKITSVPSVHDRRYHPTQEDIRNMSRKLVNRIRNNMFDQDALETFLICETEQQPGFQYFLRKYVSSDVDPLNERFVSE